MKKILVFLLFVILTTSCFAQTDTSSTFIADLPAVVKIDSTYIGIFESPYTTFKITWKNLQRNMNYYNIGKKDSISLNDRLTFTRRSGVAPNIRDTTYSIPAYRLYTTMLKDSVQTDVGIATTSIFSTIDSLDGALSAALGLKTNVITTDSLRDDFEVLTSRVDTTEATLLLKAGVLELDGLRDSLYAEVGLRAYVSTTDSIWVTTDSLQVHMSSAEAGISAVAGGVDSLFASLYLYAKRDSIVGYINILPDSIKISADHIILDGDVVATSLTGKTVTGAIIQTDTTGQRVKIQNPSIIFENAFAKTVDLRSSGTSERPTLTIDLGIGGVMEVSNDLSVTGNITLGGNGVATESWVTLQGYLTTMPSHGNEAHTSTFLTSSDESWRATDVTAIGASLTNTGGTLSVTGYNNSDWDSAWDWVEINSSTAVLTSGTYSNPTWITQLADSKIHTGSGGNAPAYFNGSGNLSLGSVSSPITMTAGAIGIQVANTSQGGYLSSTDWNTFNGKSTVSVGSTSSYYLADIDYTVETISITINGTAYTFVTEISR